MSQLQGLIGLAAIIAVAVVASSNRRAIPWRTIALGLGLQIGFALLVLRFGPGRDALNFVAEQVAALVAYAKEGTVFVFGPLAEGEDGASIFAFSVLPVIIFLGALIGLLYYLRVIQFVVEYLGGAIAWALRTTKLESVYAATVIFLGQTEAPLLIAPYLKRLTRSELFTVMTAGFAAVAGSTLVGYALLGAPLTYLLAASIMNAPGALYMARLMMPKEQDEEDVEEISVLDVRDEDSANVIDATGNGAIAGGRIAVTVAALLIAFVSLIALANGLLSGVGGFLGDDTLTLQKVFGYVFAPVAWAIGVPWSEAQDAGNFIGLKTVLNEFVAFGEFGPRVGEFSDKAVIVITFALAGFANFASIAIQIGTLGGLAPERRGEVARMGLKALLAGSLVNLSNAAIAGVVFTP